MGTRCIICPLFDFHRLERLVGVLRKRISETGGTSVATINWGEGWVRMNYRAQISKDNLKGVEGCHIYLLLYISYIWNVVSLQRLHFTQSFVEMEIVWIKNKLNIHLWNNLFAVDSITEILHAFYISAFFCFVDSTQFIHSYSSTKNKLLC